MQKDPYLVLGLSNNATEQEIEQAYRTLRNQYAAQRFEEGEVGANASRMIGELDQAYTMCMDDLSKRQSRENYGSNYGEILKNIEDGRIEKAQELLDDVELRDAEWHYIQARIYYKQQWFTEAKTQLHLALELEPNNEKYLNTLNKLNQKINGNADFNGSANSSNQASNTAQNDEKGAFRDSRAGYQRPNRNTSNASNTDACCNTCSTLICCDCCCECMGGDLIPCC